jgi:hypothetical protein
MFEKGGWHMNLTRKGFLWFAALLMLSACNKPSDYLYVHADGTPRSIIQKVKDVSGNSYLDVFWLIGGMTEQEANFTAGVQQFMTSFVTKKYNWKMGVIGNNTTQPPMLGVPSGFDMNSPNPVPSLVQAVKGAVEGDDGEIIFDPIVYNLTKFPGFVRPNAMLAIIMTNDAHDSSRGTTTAAQMITFLQGLKGGDISKVIVYGVFGAGDLNCNRNQIDEPWTFAGSELDKLIKQTGGENFSLCDATFGAQLAKIGDNLYKHLDNPRIQLTTKPDPTSIHVFFHGKELPGGPQNFGGLWFYDINSNSVVFYDLTFAKNDTEEVNVQYSDDTGTN